MAASPAPGPFATVVDKPPRPRLQLAALGGAAAITVPGLVLRLTSAHPPDWLAAVCFGFAVVGAAFILAWGAEVLQLDVSQGLTLAVVALIAVMPEYAVDFAFTWKAGKDPEKYAPLALANMTGGNRLLIGIGWSMVVLLAAWRMRRIARSEGYEGELDTDIHLDRPHAIEIGFLAVATLYSLTLPLKRTLSLFDAVVLVTIFALYAARISRAPATEPRIVGPAQLIARLPRGRRRATVALMLAGAAAVIVACAAPFADALVRTGEQFGVSTFLLVQWVAPLASEAPELLVAGLFAWRLNTGAALGTLVSSKVNQWTLLVGTLPIVFSISAGALQGLPLDTLQREELFLTAAQSVFAVAVLSSRSLSVKEGLALLGLFLSQFVLGGVLPGDLRELERLGIGALYLACSVPVFWKQRAHLRGLTRDAFVTPVAELTHEP